MYFIHPSEPSDLCSLPVKAGPCRGYFPRWFYNSTSARCERFVYGGCQGNPNRFEIRESCENACVCGKFYLHRLWIRIIISLFITDICTLQPETGPCRASIPRYFYNITSGKCEEFIYGGCGGNDNRFTTAAECAAQCGQRKYKQNVIISYSNFICVTYLTGM